MRVATQAGGGEFMNYHDAVTAVLERAGRIILPGHAVDVVAAAEREFEQHGSCDAKFMEPIEQSLRECLEAWSIAQKRSIWRSTEDGQQVEDELDDSLDAQYLDLALEPELLQHVIKRLSGDRKADEMD